MTTWMKWTLAAALAAGPAFAQDTMEAPEDDAATLDEAAGDRGLAAPEIDATAPADDAAPVQTPTSVQQDVDVYVAPEDRARAAETTPYAPVDEEVDAALEPVEPMDTAIEPMPDAPDAVSVDVDIDDDDDGMDPRFVAVPDFEDDDVLTGVGTHVSVGGGVNNFIDDTARSATNPGGEWHARAAVGTRSIIGVEGQYEGGARDIQAAGVGEDAWLVSSALEGAVRLNAPIAFERGIVEPYALGGLGWQNFNIVNHEGNTAAVDDNDNLLTVPLGVGLMAGYDGLVADARFTYRYAVGSDMFGPTENGFDDNSLSNWSLGGSLGFEF